MNVERLIAERMGRSNRHLSSRPVVRIATYGVSLGVALMILSAAVVHGFQHEIKKLVVGFDSHIQVAQSDPGARGLTWTSGMLDSLRALDGVAHVSLRHERAGILETTEALQGVIIRGLDTTSMTSRIQSGLLRGKLPSATESGQVMIGAPLANKMEVDTGSKVMVYVVVGPDDIRPRPARISGIYETGLLEFDQRHVWVPAHVLQDAAARGAEGQVVVDATARGSRAVGQAFGHNEKGASWRGRWTNLPEGTSSQGRKSLSLVDLAHETRPLWVVGRGALADTVAVLWNAEMGWHAEVSEGTHRQVADGYDIWSESLDQMGTLQQRLFQHIPYTWQATRVDQQHPEMFSWLSMLDLNVDVIVGLMVLISIINMTSALLIIILERRRQVGLLKAIGMSDGAVMRSFLWHAAGILGKGFIWGNAIGLGLIGAQKTWQLVPLNPAAYYVSAVPILVDLPGLVAMEFVAFALCIVAMVLPALWSTRIHPAITLRMN